MKVVCLIRPDAPLYFFANRISERHPIALVIVERPPRKGVVGRLEGRGVADIVWSLAQRLKTVRDAPRRQRVHERFFGDAWRGLRADLDVLEVEDVNSPAVQEKLQGIRPDLLLDHGTSIVKDQILENAALSLNLHWGLSPYYRGTACTEWALINWDPHNIGVTIHKLSRVIDGGDILAQARATVTATDNVHSINMQLTMLGTGLVIEALDRLSAGEELRFVRQDHARGYATYSRQWSPHLSRQIRAIEEGGAIARMLERPARKERLPLVELPVTE